MQCSECEAPVEEGAGVCPACGAVLDGTATDPGTPDPVESAPTVVTGGASAALPRKGQVLAERYEVQKRLSGDALSVRYHAFDQEAESSVLVTVVEPALLGSQRERDTVRDRIAHTLGAGGRYLSGLLDCDREGALVFTVEAWPAGTAFSDVMRARASRGERFTPAEILPLVSQLGAALEAIPPPFCHGDVRAMRVWIDPDGLRLTGPFLAAALPAEAIATAVRTDPKLRWALAPEARRGSMSDSADRWGTAAIALEALTGVTAESVSFQNLAIPTSVSEALRDLMSADPSMRPGSLRALVAALAQAAGIGVPEIEPAPYRRVRRAGSSERALLAVTASGGLTAPRAGGHPSTEPSPAPEESATVVAPGAAATPAATAPAPAPARAAKEATAAPTTDPVGLEEAPTIARDEATRRVVGHESQVGLEEAPTTRHADGYLDEAPTVQGETVTKAQSAESTHRIVAVVSAGHDDTSDAPITHDTAPATRLADTPVPEPTPPPLAATAIVSTPASDTATTAPIALTASPATTATDTATTAAILPRRALDPTADVQTTAPVARPAAPARLLPKPRPAEVLPPERKTARLELADDDEVVHSLESKPTAPRRIPGASPDGTQELSLDAILEARPSGPRRIAGASPEGTQEITADAILEARPTTKRGSDRPAPAKPRVGGSGSELDPRLVRAALELSDDGSGPRRPARAESTLELGPGDIEMVAAAVLSQNAAAATPKAASHAQAPTPSASATSASAGASAAPAAVAPAPSRQIPARRAASPRLRRDPTPVKIPHDIKPIPRARTASSSGFPAPTDKPLFDDSQREDAKTGPYAAQPGDDGAPPVATPPPGSPLAPAPGAGRPRQPSPLSMSAGAPGAVAGPPPSVQSPRLAPPPRAPAPAAAGSVTPRTPMHAASAPAPAPLGPAPMLGPAFPAPAAAAPRPQQFGGPGAYPALPEQEEEDTASHPKTRAGRWIILLALLLAAAIIGVGLLVAQRRRIAADRERAVQDRLELIRRMEGPH